MIDKIMSLLVQLASEKIFVKTGLVPAINIRFNEDEVVRLLKNLNPDLTLPVIPESYLKDSPEGMVVRWTNDGVPHMAIRTDGGWAVVGEPFDVSPAGFCELLTDENVRDVQMIRPADNFLSPEDALMAICEANDLEVPSPLMDEKPEDEDEGDDEDEDSTSEDGNLTKVFRQMMEALSDGFVDVEDDDPAEDEDEDEDILSKLLRNVFSDAVVDDEDEDEDGEEVGYFPEDEDEDDYLRAEVEILPGRETLNSLRRVFRNLTPGTDVWWLGRVCGYRVRKVTPLYWVVVDPDTYDRLDEDEARRWFYFNCDKSERVQDRGAESGLGVGVINNGQLARILKRSDIKAASLIFP